MDTFTIDAFSPQEDEFALLALGVPSVYRAFFDPRRLSEVARWLDPHVWTNCSNDWIEVWRNFLLNVADGKTERLLLKSPNHTFRIGALLKAFPNASYIWVVRDPEEVLFSNRKMWTSMFDEYALWDWQMPKLDAFLRQAFCHAGECLEHATHALPKNRLIVINFDDLIQTPLKTVEAINHRLLLGDWSQTKGLIEAAASKVDYRKDSYCADDTIQEVKEAMRHLREIQQYALINHGV